MSTSIPQSALNDLAKVNEVIEKNLEEAITRLGEAVAIPSASAVPSHRPAVLRMAQWLKEEILKDWPEATVELHSPEPQVIDGVELPYPPLVCAKLTPEDPNKKVLTVYAHYDTQPAQESDGWKHNPWQMSRYIDEDGEEKLGGRGVSDDKSQCIAWLSCVKAHKDAGVELPVNVRLLYEGMEETGCWGTDRALAVVKAKSDMLDNVDYVGICDGGWCTPDRCGVCYGLKGYTLADIEVSGPNVDLHSGGYGGIVYHPMDDLIYLMSLLKDENDKILIPGINEQVAEVTETQLARYKTHELDREALRARIGAQALRHNDDLSHIIANWHHPAMTLHGIEGAHHEPGTKTVIPCKVIGKMSIRSVPNMDGPTAEKCIIGYLENLMAKRKTANELKVTCRSGPWWYSDPDMPVTQSLVRAIEAVHGHSPLMIRSGGSIPCTPMIQEATQAPTVCVPLGRPDDGAHSQNESLRIESYREGQKLYTRWMQELAHST
eukprot:Blabericola_migrator_1__3474@NODE_2027_length_3390_cov_503_443274_g1288_i0_p1_GENE_NODE_2027_length_3390_cov_503_443274_g1288_i0NODE_2027_length_3390_cov_503_443274_g1288_i0_p1_ORF_typecomplete_len492_score111_15Peptidase_M20/PF01546_28/2_5e47M20_dimer/PF07687_14/1_8e15Peptidase_M28/PF04389_17/1_9e06_NODE_2027_length_3390_cov_503_443274_g1288_i015913066